MTRTGNKEQLRLAVEALVRGELVMQGYWRNEAETARVLQNGWLHTGDIGHLDKAGRIVITDRKKDMIVNDKGDNVSPQKVEGMLTLQPEIAQAMVMGDKRPYLTCLVMIDQENVEKYAQDHDIPFTNYASLCRAVEIQDLIQREIEAVNVNFARVETIKKFYLIERQLTPEDEELTPTLKLKRSFVNKRYAIEINAMYGERAVA